MGDLSEHGVKIVEKVLRAVGGATPIGDGYYHSLSEVIKLYTEGQRILTPYGEHKILLGADISLKWLDSDEADKIDMKDVVTFNDPRNDPRAIRLAIMNQMVPVRVISFFIVPSGKVFYAFDISRESEYAVRWMDIRRDEVNQAADTIKNVAFTEYHRSGLVTGIFAHNGETIDNRVVESKMGRLEVF